MERFGVRRVAALTASAVLASASVVAWVFTLGEGQAAAHGSMQSPPSRIYLCYQEGAETPRSEACRALLAAGGPQALYDWNGVLVPDVDGRHREVIPDGKLCSAGNEAFRGLDLDRGDWPTTNLPSEGNYQFLWHGTAPHVGTFEFYVTRDGYDPAAPLTWGDLESEPFLRAERPPLEGNLFKIDGQLPGKQGRHLIYTIYQRSDSPEAFYACSDVVFGGGGTQQGNSEEQPTPRPHNLIEQRPEDQPPGHEHHDGHGEHHTPGGQENHQHENHQDTPPPGREHRADTRNPGGHDGHGEHHTPGGDENHNPGGGEWAAGTSYAAGAQVTYQGTTYVAVQGHQAQPGWEPPNVPALWHAAVEAGGDGVPDWRAQTPYSTGAHVTYQGVVYMCRQGHVALPGWEPTQTPALWERMG
ncbi:lytic polysaccharide monooxygenase [Micromonospora sp. NPDC000207]|uniref:lytic polysaccharide monooxygenase n=1 Tax=Micromonospora sp. NPDC000207 TaxID=3154246 RepID=UPI003317A330